MDARVARYRRRRRCAKGVIDTDLRQ